MRLLSTGPRLAVLNITLVPKQTYVIMDAPPDIFPHLTHRYWRSTDQDQEAYG
jgi:hypothetical protein